MLCKDDTRKHVFTAIHHTAALTAAWSALVVKEGCTTAVSPASMPPELP
jgi:hypothetical protein